MATKKAAKKKAPAKKKSAPAKKPTKAISTKMTKTAILGEIAGNTGLTKGQVGTIRTPRHRKPAAAKGTTSISLPMNVRSSSSSGG